MKRFVLVLLLLMMSFLIIGKVRQNLVGSKEDFWVTTRQVRRCFDFNSHSGTAISAVTDGKVVELKSGD